MCGRFLLAHPAARAPAGRLASLPADPLAEAVAELAVFQGRTRLKTSGEIFPTNICPVLVGIRTVALRQAWLRRLPGPRDWRFPGGDPENRDVRGDGGNGAAPPNGAVPADETVLAPGAGIAAMAMLWGFPVPWPKPDVRINARSETAGSLKTWRGPLGEGRCLIPAAGFFEWGVSGGRKRKFLLTLPDGEGMFLAGLCGTFPNARSWPERFAILTTAANSSLSDIHERMPVVVRRSEMERWFRGDYASLFNRGDVRLVRREAA